MEIVITTSAPDGMGGTNTTATIVHEGVTWAQIWSDGAVTLHGPAPSLADTKRHYAIFQPEIISEREGAVLKALLTKIAVLESAIERAADALGCCDCDG